MLIPTGFAQAKYRFLLTGDNEEMIFTMGHDDGGNPATNLANLLMDACGDTFCTPGAMQNGYTFVGVDVQKGTQASGAAPYISGSSTLAPIVGTSAGNSIPPNTAILIEKATNAAGRRGKGRFYLPGQLPDSFVDNAGNLTAGLVTAINAATTNWLTRLGSDGLPPYLLHQTPPATPDPIIGLACDPRAATQRLRMRR